MSTVATAILIDNMYVENATNVFELGRLDPRKFPNFLLRKEEEHYMTYIFDALPFVPKEGATERQIGLRQRKKTYLDALEYGERIAVEQGYVSPKFTECPKCSHQFYTPAQKLVDVKLSVRLVSLAWGHIVKKIVLVSGDGDLIPAVDAARETGTIVRLEYVIEQGVNTNKGLIKMCQEKHQLMREDFLKAILQKE